jgi:hypothetical protein
VGVSTVELLTKEEARAKSDQSREAQEAKKAAAEAATTERMAALFASLSSTQLDAIVAGAKALESAAG